MKSLVGILAAPMATGTRLNRDWMVGLLHGFQGRFLELGPGDAPLLTEVPDDERHEKWVVELPGVIEHSRRLGYRCLEQNLGTDEWDIEDQSMDVIVSCQVLEHIPDVDHVMSESRRVLKPGGKLLISTPNQGSLLNIVLLLLTINPPYNMVSDRYYGLGNPFSKPRPSAEAGTRGHGHLRLFATRAMKDLLRVYGFRVLRCHGGSWGVPLVGGMLARVCPYYGLFTTVLGEKL
jgi:SAM-dependent methyltransferase